MRSRITYLMLGIFTLMAFVQCKDSVTQLNEPPPDQDANLENSNLKQPDLITPESGTEHPTSLTVEWTEVDGIEQYHIQMSTDEDFTTTVVDRVVDSTAIKVNNISNDTFYHWQVRSLGDGKEGPWSETWNFKTVSEAQDSSPTSTNLKTPSDGSEVRPLSVELKWESIDAASKYNIQLADDQNFETVLIDEKLEDNFYEASDLDYQEDYYWRVEPVVPEEETEWSEVYEFVTTKDQETIPAATLSTPEDGSSDQETTVNLKWEEISGIYSYKVQVASDESFSSPTVDESVENTSYDVNDLDKEQTYYWRVQATGDNDSENWSKVYSFTTKFEQTPSVTLISPEDETKDLNTSLSFEWKEISDIYEYKIQIADNESFSSPVVDETVGNTSYDVNDLNNNQTYYWRVQAGNDNDSENWSSIRSFSTKAEQNTSDGDYANSVEGDRQALMDLYESTNGNNWKNNSGWGSGNPSDSWYGIETDTEGRVTRVDLYNNGLSGQLPESIGNLSKVKYMNIKRNNLSGSIPTSIGDMSSMERLILAGRNYEIGGTLKEPPLPEEKDTKHYHQGKRYSNTNNFTGTIPATIGNLSNLIDLEIANQPNIIGPIPSEIGNLSNLKGLYLSFNDFSGTTLPSSIGNLTNLKHLYIASAQLEGNIPASLENLTKLSFLNMGESSNSTPDNHLTGEIPDFSNFTNLKSIVFTDNELTGEWPHYWNNGNFTELNTLRFTWNNITGTLNGFGNLPNISSFGLEGNDMSGTIKSQLSEVPRGIIILGLGWNNFEGEIPSNWPDFYRIRTIRLNDNNLTNSISCDFWSSIDTSAMKLAHLQNNEFNSNCSSSMNDLEGNGDPDISVGGNNL